MTKAENDYYFWLGSDGDPIDLTEEEFEQRQEAVRKEREDFLNVTIGEDEGHGG